MNYSAIYSSLYDDILEGKKIKQPKQPKKAKGTLSYKILTKAIKDDFIEGLEGVIYNFLNTNQESYYAGDMKISKNGFFRWQGYRMWVIVKFGSSDKTRQHHNDDVHRILFIGNRSVEFEVGDWWKSDPEHPHGGDYASVIPGAKHKVMDIALEVFKKHRFFNDYIIKEYPSTVSRDSNSFGIKMFDLANDKMRSKTWQIVETLQLNPRFHGFEKSVRITDPHDFSFNKTDKMLTYMQGTNTVSVRPGKGLKKFLKMACPTDEYMQEDETIKQMATILTTTLEKFTLHVVDGEDIDKYYLGKNYSKLVDTGSLGNSCMRYRECVDDNYFEIYKDHCKMLILLDEETDTIASRALLWDDLYVTYSSDDDRVKRGGTVNIMDRIYGSEDAYVVMKKWARENGYLYKRYQTYDNESTFVDANKDKIELTCEMDICLTDYSRLPYMDTFAWGDSGSIRNDYGWGHYSARDTEGGLEGEDEDYDEEW